MLFYKILAALPITSFPGSGSCYPWLQSGVAGTGALQFLQTAVNLNQWGHGVIKDNSGIARTIAAILRPAPGVTQGVATTVNDESAFFKSNQKTGARPYPGNTLPAQAAILIHEMGHAVISTPNFLNDRSDPQAEAANNEQVNTYCGEMIDHLPSITAVSPNAGPAGTSVTITGTNFGAVQGTSTVAFNGTLANPTSWSADGTTYSGSSSFRCGLWPW